MAAQPAGPIELTLDDLLSHRPRSHTEGIFPDRYLGQNEVLLYSTRPSLVGFAFPAVALGVSGGLLIGLLLWFGQSQLGINASVLDLVIAIMVALLVAGVVGRLFTWYYVCYALTTSRVLVKHGAFTRCIIDIPHGAVQSVMFTETGAGRGFDFGTLQFSSASVGGFIVTSTGSRPGVVNWRSTPLPVESRAFYELVQRARFE
jgi:membrane protein YdbS with pleckstrin-like domain